MLFLATFNFRPGSTYVVVKTELKSKTLQKKNEVGLIVRCYILIG